MYQDFMTFIHSILSHSSEAESLLPDSFREHIPIDSFMNFFSELNSSVKLLGAVITLILALLLCFFGYKFARIFMSITGFLAGAVIGLTVSYKFFDLTGPLVILCTLAAGIIIALLSFHIYMAGLFILCFILAFMAAASLLPFTGDIQFFLATLTGFIIGSLSLKFIRPVMILSSALVGAATAAGLIAAISGRMGFMTLSRVSDALITLVLCILGIIVQFLTTRNPEKKARKKKEE
ncbi:MAG: DUF4203 domain-containing protein [Eubacterium sp.]|nr:DUF4203 domain-containing protein [Eubacterium sp.]